jgi:transposase-like protein
LDTTEPLLKIENGNKYILMAIDHYSKWCETKLVLDHTTYVATRFLEEEIICRYEVPKFILIDNDGGWSTKFDNLCKVYGIHH